MVIQSAQKIGFLRFRFKLSKQKIFFKNLVQTLLIAIDVGAEHWKIAVESVENQ